MKNIISILPIIILTACGGDSSSSNSIDEAETIIKNTGVFLDSPVINIGYRTETLQGVTNAQGEYEYVTGETVTFFIGQLEFPSALAKEILSPLDLLDTTNLSNSKVVNMTRLLQTLDEDGDASNGITITETAKTNASQVDFNASVSDFSNSVAVTTLITNAGQNENVIELINSEAAITHFGGSLEAISEEQYETIDIPNEYTVYGGNERFSGGSSNMKNYTLLGKAKGIETFNGMYKYYAITNKNDTLTIKIDAVKGSNNIHYPTNTTSNTFTDMGDTWMYLDGAPDEVYVSIGVHGYILIDVSDDDLTGITVYGE